MNASPTQQRKAKNIIWTAAENYQVEPQFLSFDHQGQANFFLNLIIGLVYKWLDWEKLEAFFGCFEGTALESTYDGLLWLALEQVVYEKELPLRPVLEELRREHSHNMMNMAAWLVENNRLVQYQVAWCQVNLGKKPFLMPWDRRMLEELRFKGNWDTDRIIQEFRRIVRQYFKVNLTAVQKTSGKRKHSLLQMLFRKRRRVPARMFRAKDVLDDDEARKSGSAGSSWTGGSRRIDEETWEVLEKRYGPQVFAKEEVLRLEKFRRLVYQCYYISNGMRSSRTVMLSELDPDLVLDTDTTAKTRSQRNSLSRLFRQHREQVQIDSGNVSWMDICEKGLIVRRIAASGHAIAASRRARESEYNTGLGYTARGDSIYATTMTPTTSENHTVSISPAAVKNTSLLLEFHGN